MKNTSTRRHFLSQLGIVSIGFPLLARSTDFMSEFIKKGDIKFGYSAITWGGNDPAAIKDIASLGFKGIQLRANAYTTFGQKVDELKKLLSDAKLELVMFSSGNADINTGKDEQTIAQHVTHAKFVKSLGGNFIQVTNGSRPKDRAPSEEELVTYGNLLTAIGKQTKAVGVETTYHNHMGQLGQTPEEVETILKTTDPAFVSFELDTAHYQQGGGDPVTAIKKYKSRLKALHIKDVRNNPTPTNARGYQFVEIGQGRVDFPGVFKALDEINFKGYAIIELDGVPDKAKTPLECAVISKTYLNKLLNNVI
ncbi:MAG: sugar phosphate isomerase/epimerase [Chitinophagaceae bacterium]